ncbi:hypothetical protein [Avibacterium sp. 21-599]|uniref:hypothetical protein n=1 Tax=Avibacterium sp. 21-599 TaxID=2911528 RepID=UPI002247812B|nr:hypothetical protein [Avibacterium sp. 21-599]MCW9718135.1 hypothetical protein [Avibacterium sp. 21-599]
MIKLDLPIDCMNYTQVIDSCINKMRKNNILKITLKKRKYDLIEISKLYMKWGKSNELFKCLRLHNNQPINMRNCYINDNQATNGMIKIYTIYFVKNRCGGFYDKIINNAKNPDIQCPFCGGINFPSELDHFLPKKSFSYYAIFPYNLIPICKDCNQIYKREFYPKNKNQQLIHPYLDSEQVFNEKWLYAKCIIDSTSLDLGMEEKLSVEFYVNPPSNWEEDKKEKVKFHFGKFNLAERFAVHSVSSLKTLLNQIKGYKSGNLPMQDAEKYLIDSDIEREKSPNSWKKALFEAVKKELPTIWSNI